MTRGSRSLGREFVRLSLDCCTGTSRRELLLKGAGEGACMSRGVGSLCEPGGREPDLVVRTWGERKRVAWVGELVRVPWGRELVCGCRACEVIVSGVVVEA